MPSALGKRGRAENDNQCDEHDATLEFVVAGCGAGATAVYDGAVSSTFLLRARRRQRRRPGAGGGNASNTTTTPLLIVDLGIGATRALSALCGGAFPAQAPIYISHNHTDHAGELPVVAAVERARSGGSSLSSPIIVLAAADGVAETLKTHRLDELRSTGRPQKDFIDLRPVRAAVGAGAGDADARAALVHPLPGRATSTWKSMDLGLSLVRAAHSERCFGFLLMGRRRQQPSWEPLLGWSGDSAADPCVYRRLARAPIVVVDARPGCGTREHAGVAEVVEAALRQGGSLSRARRVVIYGYGGSEEGGRAAHELVAAIEGLGGGGGRSGSAPASGLPTIEVATPGMVIEVPWPSE